MSLAAHATSATNAFTEENASQSITTDSVVDSALGDTVSATASDTGAITVTATKSGGATTTAVIKPPNGATFADGNYAITNIANATGASVSITPAPVGVNACTGSGNLDVTDVSVTGATVTSFAAEYYLQCSSGSGSVSGSVRINSATGYEIVTQNPLGSVAFGSAAVGHDTTKDLTLTAAGSAAVQLGTPTISGGSGPTAFSLSNDNCTGASITAGASCTVTVHFNPSAVSTYFTRLVYPADTPLGHRDIVLSGTGATPPSAPTNVQAFAGDDGIGVQWSAPATPNGTISGYNVYRDTGSGFSFVTEVASRTYADLLSPGSSASYEVAAVNAAGEGTVSGSVSSTALAPLATSGTTSALTVDAAPHDLIADGVSDVVDPVSVTASSLTQVSLGGTVGATSEALTIGTTLGGARLTAGDYPTTFGGDSTHPALQLGYGGTGCNGNGELHLTDADFHADGSPDVLTGTYSIDCGGTNPATGQIRYRSTSKYPAMKAAPNSATPHAIVGQDAAASDFTITNNGTADETLGSTSIAGTAAAEYSLESNTCDGADLSPGQTCGISVGFHPTTGGTQDATLVQADQTARGERDIDLAGVGEVVATAPQDFTTTPAAGRVVLGWAPPADDGGAAITGYQILRGVGAGAVSLLHSTGPDAQSYVDTTAVPGTAYTYEVRAETEAGDGAATSGAAATARRNEIVYVEDTTGNGVYDVYAAAPDGSDPVPVVTGGGDKSEPVVSPDGTKVAYSQSDNDGIHIWIARMDGTGSPMQLTSGSNLDDEDPSWSPDGKTVAFDRIDIGDDFGNTAVYTVPASGGAASELSDAQQGYRPSWTPDGASIVFAGLRGSTDGIDIVPSDGSGGRTLVSGTTGGDEPEVSPDGKQVAYVVASGTYDAGACFSQPIPKTHVELISINGGTPTALTSTSASAFVDDPSWWPDGSAITYARHTTCDAAGTIPTVAVTAAGTTALLAVGNDVDEPSVNIAPAPPRPASKPTATIGNGGVYVTWTPSTVPASMSPVSFVVRRSAAGGAAPTSPTDGTAVYSGTTAAALAAGLTNGKTYTFSVFEVSAEGGVSEPVTIKAQPLVPPIAKATAIDWTGTGLPFPVSWSTSSSPKSFEVFTSKQKAPFTPWITSTTAHSATLGATGSKRVTQGDSWRIAVTERDSYGNLSVAGNVVTVTVPYDDASRYLRFSKGWTLVHSKSRWLGTVHTATKKGKSVSARLHGTGLAILGDKGPKYGSFTVYIDGKKAGKVNTHSSKSLVRQVIWKSKKLKNGWHAIKVVVAGTRHHAMVGIDAMTGTP